MLPPPQNEIFNRCAGSVVVLGPRADVREGILFSAVVGGEEDDLENYVCFTAEIDPKAKDAAKYRELALAKAFVSLKTGMASSLVQTQYPYLYDAGDTKWGGSTIMPGGIIIGFSGVQAVFDEMIAEWMASAIRAIYRDIMTCKGGMMDQPSGFIVG